MSTGKPTAPKSQTLLNDRFEILDEIGRGSQAVTYRARDHESGEIVALKELDFRRVEDWKAQELFEREGTTLRGLDHPAIPRYVDAFAIEEEDQIRLYLAQEFIEGPTLQDELDFGGHWSEDKARKDALLLLDALAYLHTLSPPVVHRDIKPSNVIRRPDGGLALVDFGAVQNIVPKTVGGSTIIGTPGYMPVEQVMGRAVPGSDIYALGATLVHLLTRTDPSELPVQRNRLQFRDRAPSLGDDFANVLDDMTHPSVEDRIDSAERARERLDGRKIVVSGELPAVHFPPWATVTQKDDGMTFVGFNTFGLDGIRRYITIEEAETGLTLTARGEAPAAEARQLGAAAAAFALGIILFFVFPIAVPIVFLGIGFALMGRAREARQRRQRDPVLAALELDEDTYTLQVEGGRRRGRLKSVQEFDVDQNALVLVESDGTRTPIFSMTVEDRFRWKWLLPYLNRRVQELRGETVFDQGDFDQREEFWKAEPVEVDKKG